MNKKAAIQLSANFIIILIIGIVLLGMGFYIFNRVFQEGMDLNREISSETDRQIRNILDSGDRVAIAVNEKKVSGDYSDFWIGIRNIYDTEKTFNIIINKEGFQGCTIYDENLQYFEEVSIPGNDYAAKLILIKPVYDENSNQCSGIVRVKIENNDYGSPQLITMIKP
ncbi:hypothetical protein JW949_00595 [Candidatus Woesearchaeota archaeon]|nr:hypothetical protein [Candidatus Woesearchaeota archaeon]